MSDGYINISTKIDKGTSDKDLDKLDKRLKETEKAGKSSTASMLKTGIAIGSVAAAAKTAAALVKDLTDAYKTQEKAEVQLESAAKNNPYLTDASVQNLKNYASELQSISTIGDEELLPHMASLAAAGRTQDEIMQIMSASVDMAASGAFTLDSAVRNLNKSYGGLAGELGESIPEIKALTAEQLKNGEATKLMAERYKGIAAETAAATGTQEQLNNAIGDLKEEFGASFEKGIAPIRRFFTELISGWANAKRAMREYYEAKEDAEKGIITEQGAEAVAGEKFLEYLAARDEYEAGLAYNSEEVNKQLKERAAALLAEYNQMKANAIQAREGGRAEEARRKAKEAELKVDRELEQYLRDAQAELEKQINTIRLNAEARGVEADETEILNAKMQAYVSLIANSNGKVSQSHKLAQAWISDIRDTSEALSEQGKALEDVASLQEALNIAMSAISEIDDRPESEKMREQLDTLDEMYAKVQEREQISADAKAQIYADYTDKRAILEQQLTEQIAAEEKLRKENTLANLEANLQIAADFAAQYQTTMNSIAELATSLIQGEAEQKMAELEEQYANGEVSAEEYERKKADIEKKAAKEEYKIKMWQWTADLATAAANTSLGVTKAIAQGGVMGIITGALVAAAGAAQTAMILGNKPIPPSFSTGGVISSSSTSGDNTLIAANGKERVLTAAQNAAFERLVYGNGGNMNVQIINSASNDVRATAEQTDRGVRIAIRKTVGADMRDGRFNSEYRTMQNNISGVRYI